jgi:superfamily II DNA/RNA helicase
MLPSKRKAKDEHLPYKSDSIKFPKHESPLSLIQAQEFWSFEHMIVRNLFSESDLPLPLLNYESNKLSDPLLSQILPCTLSKLNVHVISEARVTKTIAQSLAITYEALKFAGKSVLILCCTTKDSADVKESIENCDLNVLSVTSAANLRTNLNAAKSFNPIIVATAASFKDMVLDSRITKEFIASIYHVILYNADLFVDYDYNQVMNVIFENLCFEVLSCYSQSSLQDTYISRLLTNYWRKSKSDTIEIKQNLISIVDVPKSKQTVLWVPNESKIKKLIELLWVDSVFQPPIIIFVKNSEESLKVAERITKKCEIVCKALTVPSQESEEEDIERFKRNEYPLLICSYSKLRIAKLPNCPIVINYDISSVSELVKQCAKSTEWCISFINSSDTRMFYQLNEIFREMKRVTPLPKQFLDYF